MLFLAQVLVMGGEESGKSSLLRAVVEQGELPTRAAPQLPSRAAASPATGSSRGRPAAARATAGPRSISAVLQTASSDREGIVPAGAFQHIT